MILYPEVINQMCFSNTCPENIKVNLFSSDKNSAQGQELFDFVFTPFTLPELQIVFQNLSGMMSGKNKVPSNIYENLSDINFYVFKNSNKIQLLLRNISPLVYKSRIYTVRY